MIGRIPITQVAPVVDCGRWPAKAAVGERVTISATVFREGHDAVAANAVVITPDGKERPFNRMHKLPDIGRTDGWETEASLDAEGTWTFRVEAWGDPVATWRHDAEIKIPLEQDVELVCEEGARLLERAAKLAPKAARPAVLKAVTALRDADRAPVDRIAAAIDPDLAAVIDAHPVRELVTASDTYPIRVERERQCGHDSVLRAMLRNVHRERPADAVAEEPADVAAGYEPAPGDLKKAAVMIARSIQESALTASPVIQQSVSGRSYSKTGTSGVIPPEAMSILRNYKRVWGAA